MGNAGQPHPWNLGKMKKGLEATKSPTPLDIAWAAGLFEGEGSCSGYVGKKRPHILATQARIYQKDRWILDKCRELFGGHVCEMHVKSIRNKPDEPITTMYSWQISGARARGFIMTIFTYLSPRRRLQAKKALGISLTPSS